VPASGSPRLHLYHPNERVTALNFMVDPHRPGHARVVSGGDIDSTGESVPGGYPSIILAGLSYPGAPHDNYMPGFRAGRCFVCDHRRHLMPFFLEQMGYRGTDRRYAAFEMLANANQWGVPLCDRCHRDGEQAFRSFVAWNVTNGAASAGGYAPPMSGSGHGRVPAVSPGAAAGAADPTSATWAQPIDGKCTVCCCFCSLCCALGCGIGGASLGIVGGPGGMGCGGIIGAAMGCVTGALTGKFLDKKRSQCCSRWCCSSCRHQRPGVS
jgi:hypothetical protein